MTPITVPMNVAASTQEVPLNTVGSSENLNLSVGAEIGYKGEKGDKGDTGVGIASCVLNPDYTLTITLTDGTAYTTESIRGEQGARGEKGETGSPGAKGDKGDPGESIKGDKGDKGEKGDPGSPGSPGSPGAKGDKGDKGDTGSAGRDGTNGVDGYSPTATVSKSGKVATITITDKNGTTTATVSDGEDGHGAVLSVNGQTGDVVLDADDVGALPDSTAIPTKTSDLTNDSDFITGMEILSYGHSTWADFLAAYTAQKVVYCRASSGSNPGSGSQTRLAFMAYVNNVSASSITEVEFQYYRSVSSHSATQQGDQVYVYKLNKTNGWSVTVREAMSKIAVGTGLKMTYSNGTITISLDS